ncbi:hypothetical protein CRENBAI_021921 [Crenichthys baileyi]|uniref:Uncharacterized protein n=1 Tax=Crenichthys baileyi TaxID=28760 RepID=A0AAV9R015_9TELE
MEPFLPTFQNAGSFAGSSPNAPVTGYKRMVIPNQPPLTATKKTMPKPQPQAGVSSVPPPSASPVAKPQSSMAPQPVPASYTTASTPSQPTFNVQVRSAQPSPQHQAPAGHHYGQQPIRSPSQEQQYPGGPQLGGIGSRRPDPVPAQAYQPAGPRKTYITDVPQSLAPYTSGPDVQPKNGAPDATETSIQIPTYPAFANLWKVEGP